MIALALACTAEIATGRCDHVAAQLSAFMKKVEVRRVDASSDVLTADVVYYVRVERGVDDLHQVALVDASAEEPTVRYVEIALPDGDTGDRLLAFAIRTEIETTLEASLRVLARRPALIRKLPALVRAPPNVASAPTEAASLPMEQETGPPASVPATPAPKASTRFSLELRPSILLLGSAPFATGALTGRSALPNGVELALAVQGAISPGLRIEAVAIDYVLISLFARAGYVFLNRSLWTLSAGGQLQADLHIARRAAVRTVVGPGGAAGAYVRARLALAKGFGLTADLSLLGSFAAVSLVSDSGTQKALVPIYFAAGVGIDVEFRASHGQTDQ